MMILVKMVEAMFVECRCATDDAVHSVALLQE